MLFSRREAIAVLAGSVASAALPISAVSGDRPRALRRGINLSHWFAQNFEGNFDRHYARFVGARRMAQLARCGFDHVRLPVDPIWLFEDAKPSRLRDRSQRLLRAAIDQLQAHGLNVVVELHADTTSKEKLLTKPGAEAFLENWRVLASEFRHYERPVFLEVLNEPSPVAGEAWWSLQGRAIRAIREQNPSAKIIANGGDWSGVEDLVKQKAYPEEGIIYTVHYYSPILFTQQASKYGWDVAARVANLSWPLEVSQASDVARQATKDEEASRFVREAVADGSFTSSSMMSAFKRLKDWQLLNGRPEIYIGEFGVVVDAAPRDARIRWIRAVRQDIEADGWGWAFWDLSPSFGFLQLPPGSPYVPWDTMQFDAAMLSALGLAA